MAIEIGSTVPDVTLYTKSPERVLPLKISDFRGKKSVVLLFFPAVFTGTCTIEMCTIRDTMQMYEALSAEVIGISSDLPYSQFAWKNHLNLTMTLASDHNHDAVRAFGVEYPIWAGGLLGVAKRSVFVIDRDGVLKHSEILENANDLPNFERIQECLKSLI